VYSNKRIIRITTPLLFSLLAQNVLQVIDTAFLGRVGEVELGASALAGVLYIAIFTLGFGFSMGSQILIGRRNGEQNYRQIGEIVIQGIVFLSMLAAVLIPLMSVASRYWLPSLFESNHIAGAVTEYLGWRVFGILFAFANAMFRAFFVGIAQTKVLTWNAIVMALVNIILDYVLIFGNFGFPKMGIGGAALASVIAEIASMLFFVIYLMKNIDFKKYGFNIIRFRWPVMKRILDISIFMMIQNVVSIGTWMLFFLFIENYLGERPLAVANIVRSFYMILTIPANALSATTNTLVSNTIGAGRKDAVLSLVKRICRMSFSIIVVVALCVAIFPKAVIGIYTNDPSLIGDTVVPLYVLLSALPFYSVGGALFSAVSGTGNTRTALVFELVTMVFYVSYMWFIIVHLRSSVAIAWTTEHLYWIFLLIMSFIYLRSGKWKNRQI
jgi:putative MATE family efflux protein